MKILIFIIMLIVLSGCSHYSHDMAASEEYPSNANPFSTIDINWILIAGKEAETENLKDTYDRTVIAVSDDSGSWMQDVINTNRSAWRKIHEIGNLPPSSNNFIQQGQTPRSMIREEGRLEWNLFRAIVQDAYFVTIFFWDNPKEKQGYAVDWVRLKALYEQGFYDNVLESKIGGRLLIPAITPGLSGGSASSQLRLIINIDSSFSKFDVRLDLN